MGLLKGQKNGTMSLNNHVVHELMDWIGNCMDWDDIKDHAVKQPSEIYDDRYYNLMFSNATTISILNKNK